VSWRNSTAAPQDGRTTRYKDKNQCAEKAATTLWSRLDHTANHPGKTGAHPHSKASCCYQGLVATLHQAKLAAGALML
jgi:hypothetical protein